MGSASTPDIAPDVLTDGVQNQAQNVVVQEVSVTFGPWVENSEGGREAESHTIDDTDKAYIFRNGKMIVGTWISGPSGTPTKFVDQAGHVIALEPGRTWVEIYPNVDSVVVTPLTMSTTTTTATTSIRTESHCFNVANFYGLVMSSGPILASLFPDSASLHVGGVSVGGVELRALAETYGTPLFVYDEATLRSRSREAARAFDDGVAFASKSFLCGAMARLAHEEGLCVDVATGGELDIVLRSGVPANRIIVHGNNKSRDEITRAIEVGVHRLVVDNFDEIDHLRELVTVAHPLNALVRVTPGVEAHTHEYVRTGQEDTKFGFSIATGEARRAISLLREVPGLTLHGVHAHIGSQIFEVDGFRESMSILGDFTRDDDFDELCVGGGLGVAYVEGESAPSIAEWAEAIRTSARESGLRPDLRILAEPGRAIVAQAGITIYSVGVVKPVTQRTYMAVDGGMSDNPRPVLYGSGYEAFDVDHPLEDRPQRVRLVGKHCESGDVLIDEAFLPAATKPGSLVATPVTGAYGYSMASNYNRVPRPAVVFVRDGVAREVLRRETFDDLARLEV